MTIRHIIRDLFRKKIYKREEVNNETCPVSGLPVDSMGPTVHAAYRDKLYNLCCAGCIGKFENDPERYSRMVSG